jgi:predicted RNA-binding Zn-ribbon protein involved in translation (DUF1610 family)
MSGQPFFMPQNGWAFTMTDHGEGLYACFGCGWRGDTLPAEDWRCPQCGELLA